MLNRQVAFLVGDFDIFYAHVVLEIHKGLFGWPLGRLPDGSDAITVPGAVADAQRVCNRAAGCFCACFDCILPGGGACQRASAEMTGGITAGNQGVNVFAILWFDSAV